MLLLFFLKRAVIKLKNFFEDKAWAQDSPSYAHKTERFFSRWALNESKLGKLNSP